MGVLHRPEVSRKVSRAVSVVPRSGNEKIGAVSATYAAQVTCPGSCPLRGAGCYAESGPIGWLSGQRNRIAADRDADAISVLREEADAIRALAKRRNPRPLRVHVVGDSPTTEGARVTAAAMTDYTTATGQPAWTYTHAWRDVPREVWGEAAVSASCETLADVHDAQAAGYAAVVIVAEHPASGKAWNGGEGVGKVVPCPEQTRGVTCADCGLCMRPAIGRVIAFAAHGTRQGTVRRVIAAREGE